MVSLITLMLPERKTVTPAQQSKAEAKRKKMALACAKALSAASASLHSFLVACNECNDASGSRGADDGRLLLKQSINEYVCHLTFVYDR